MDYNLDNNFSPCDSDELKLRKIFKKEYKLSCPVLDDNDIFYKSLEIANLTEVWPQYQELEQRIQKEHNLNLVEFRSQLVNQIIEKIQQTKEYRNLKNLTYKKILSLRKKMINRYGTQHKYQFPIMSSN